MVCQRVYFSDLFVILVFIEQTYIIMLIICWALLVLHSHFSEFLCLFILQLQFKMVQYYMGIFSHLDEFEWLENMNTSFRISSKQYFSYRNLWHGRKKSRCTHFFIYAQNYLQLMSTADNHLFIGRTSSNVYRSLLIFVTYYINLKLKCQFPDLQHFHSCPKSLSCLGRLIEIGDKKGFLGLTFDFFKVASDLDASLIIISNLSGPITSLQFCVCVCTCARVCQHYVQLVFIAGNIVLR